MNVSNPQHRRRITWSSDISIILGQKCHIYEFFLAADDTVTDKTILSGLGGRRVAGVGASAQLQTRVNDASKK